MVYLLSKLLPLLTIAVAIVNSTHEIFSPHDFKKQVLDDERVWLVKVTSAKYAVFSTNTQNLVFYFDIDIDLIELNFLVLF